MVRLTQKKLERVYIDLQELLDYGLDWNSEDIKMLNITKINIGCMLYEKYGVDAKEMLLNTYLKKAGAKK